MQSCKSWYAILAGAALLAISACTTFKPYSPSQRDISGEEMQARLQTILDEAVNEFGLPGIQAGIRLPGGQTLLAASGTIDYAREAAPIDTDSAFRVGSTTKMFVAALICRMAEQGMLSLDDGIIKWFPQEAWAKTLTVHALLQHTSGIGETLFTDPGILVQSGLDRKKLWIPAEVVDIIMKGVWLPPPENRKFVYSNNNYLLLGLIAEKCGGDSLSGLPAREFFITSGMQDTWLLPFGPEVPVNFVPGQDKYLPFGPHLLDGHASVWDSLTFSAGALASSAPDLPKWLDAFFHGRVLGKESLDLMQGWIDARDNGRDNNMAGYGLGLSDYQLDARLLRGLPGGMAARESACMVSPNQAGAGAPFFLRPKPLRWLLSQSPRPDGLSSTPK